MGQELWGPVARRNRLLLEALAAANPDARFLFVEIPLRPRDLVRERPRPLRQVAANIWTLRPARLLPDRAGAAAERIESAQIQRVVRRIGLRRPAVWTQDPRVAGLLAHLGGSGLIYDLTDDWEAFETDPARKHVLGSQIESLLHRADVVLACSPYLREYAAARGVEAELVPNASGDMTASAGIHPRLAQISSPVLGYLGTLHEARLDLELLVASAALAPDWSFVLMGPNHLSDRAMDVLATRSNIVCLGPCAYEEVPAVLHGFDVGLVPHIVNDVSESLDPLKMYEYAAAGVPIVATPVGIPAEIAARVTQVRTPEELIAAVSTILAGPASDAPRAQAGGATWTERAERVQRAVAAVPALAGTQRSAPQHGAEKAGPDMLVSAVIVSYNTAQLTLEAIGSVLDQGLDGVEVICVDNHSHDHSVPAVRAAFASVELIDSPVNLGFGPANNLALAGCSGRFVLLLNSDARLHAGALAALLEAAERQPHTAVFGPRLLNPDGSLQRSAWPFPGPLKMLIEALGLHRLLRRTPWWEDLGLWDHGTERTVDFLSGACLLIRREVIDAVAGFDESFPFYAEETDLQYRIHRAGWDITLVPAAEVTHLGSGSSPGDARRARLFFGAQLRYIDKHFGQLGLVIARAALVLSALLRRRWSLIPIAVRPLPTQPDAARRPPTLVASEPSA